MELYSFFNSSASYRVRIALALKGIRYEVKGINIRAGEQRTLNYRELNPIGLVPTLTGMTDMPGGSIGQSLAILDYLERQYPQPPLYPQDSAQRARALEIVHTIACDIHPLNNLRVLHYLSDTLKVTDEQKKNWYAHWITEGMRAVEQLLVYSQAENFCIGDTPTIADCCLIPQWANAMRMNCDLSAFPRCQQVYEHCMQLPAFIAASPEKQPDYIGK